jgi:hypothetical protein
MHAALPVTGRQLQLQDWARRALEECVQQP